MGNQPNKGIVFSTIENICRGVHGPLVHSCILRVFRFSYGFIRDEAMHRAEALLDNTILRIDRVLDAVETTAGNSAWEVEAHLDEPDSLYAVISRFVERNPIICGSAVAFRKDFYEGGREYFSPYVYDTEEGMEQRDLGNDTYNYQEKEWFAEPLRTGKPH